MYIGVLPTCTSVHYTYVRCPQRLKLETQTIVSPHVNGAWESNLDPLEEQLELLTAEPPLQALAHDV